MRYVVSALFVMLIVSCSPFGINLEGYEKLNEPLEVAWPKSAALKYIPDTCADDQWKSPHETIEDGGGDCEDIATYLIYLLGETSAAVEIYYHNSHHCIVLYNDCYLEPQSVGYYYNFSDFELIRVMSYKSVMKTTTSHGLE